MICGWCHTEPCRCPTATDLAIYSAALAELRRQLAAATKASERAASAREKLPAGASRARVTTANARWSRAAEERERVAKLIAITERRMKPTRR